jgi:integrase
MSLSKLPSGRWRCQIHDPAKGHNVSVGTYATKALAKAAREDARRRLQGPQGGVTVSEFRRRWLSDALFARPKQSTMIHNRERTKAFAAQYGELPMRDVDDSIVADWLAGAKHAGQVPALRAMWNDAASAKAGRLVERNPWANLGISRGPGNRHKQPPSEEQVWALIQHARDLTSPYFAGWLQVAAFTGMRPGELDALRWTAVDFAAGRIRVSEQWNAGSRTFTSPKNGRPRDAILTPPAREALLALPHASEFCFVNLRDQHFTASSRAYHWKAVRAAAGWKGSLYLSSRHFFGWYAINVLELDSEDVAFAMGHEDGGELVRTRYGHRDRARALKRVERAFDTTGRVQPLKIVRKDTA